MSILEVDLSTCGYLGLHHVQEQLRPWDCLSNSPPLLADERNPLIETLLARMASLQGCEAAIFATSTFHVLWDFFDAISDEEIVIYLEDGTYPIAQWGVERAGARGVTVCSFPSHNPESLNAMLAKNEYGHRRPVVVVDGISSHEWTQAPLSDYLRSIEPFGGLLVIDDTQAIGLFGHSPSSAVPFGIGGGGSLQWHTLQSPNVLLVSSLAKGFGVPIAVFSGSHQIVDWFRRTSQTLVHCSPPCNPLLHAVENALNLNDSEGDERRKRLTDNIRGFQNMLQAADISDLGPLFPVQYVDVPEGVDPAVFSETLKSRGVRVLVRQDGTTPARIVFGLTAAHSPAEIEFAARVFVEAFHERTTPRGVGVEF